MEIIGPKLPHGTNGIFRCSKDLTGRKTALFPVMAIILLLAIATKSTPVKAHPLDEFSQKTRLYFHRDGVDVKLELAPGILVATLLLEMLDPNTDGQITADEELAFAGALSRELVARVDGQDVALHIVAADADPYEDIITGIGTVYIHYGVSTKTERNAMREHTFFYENRFYDRLTLYTLHLHDDAAQGVQIVASERDELTQALVEVDYVIGEPVMETAGADEKSKEILALSQDVAGSTIPVVDNLIELFRAGLFSPETALVLLGLAAVAGAFHAFTPGHGKTLVAAYLIANQGTPWHAIVLGLLVTVTHSASIYLLGGLVLSATQFFLPGKVIPIMELVAGVLVMILGMWMLITRLYGGVTDHAHILPNLAILNQNSVNVLVDGNAAEAVDLLIIAAEEPPVLDVLQQVGARDINICSLGCETHDLLPSIKPERLNLATVRYALKTGAADGLVVGQGKRQKLVNNLARKTGNEPAFNTPKVLDEATALLVEAVRRFPQRGKVHIPKTELSWRSLASMGLVGGMVPCPDALAVLLIALSVGQLFLGLTVVFFFSIGLSLTLIAVGILIVSSRRVLSRSPLLDRLSSIAPYAASIFITSIGFAMVARIMRSIL